MDEAWERAVEAARGKEEPEAVKSLTLDGALKCTAGRLPASCLLEQFTQLRILSIANVGLASLTDFPSLPNLERLILSDNRISGGLDALVDAGLVSLRDLDLSNNKIQTLEDLAPLAELNLLSLDLYECPVTRTAEYRSKVFASIKSLQYLDKLDAECNERPESDDEEEEDDDDEDDVDDGLDVDEDDLPSSRKDGDRRNSITSVDDEDDEDDVAEDEEDVDDSDEDEEGVQYDGVVANHVNQSHDESGSEDEDEVDDDDDDVEDEEEDDDDGDAIEVHDIEETEEEEEDGGEAEDEDDDEDEDEDGGNERGASGEIDAHAEDENGECAEDDDNEEEAVDNNVEEIDDDDEEEDYLVQSVSQADEEGASDFDQGEDNDSDDDVDDEDQDPGPADPPSAVKRKRSKDDDSDDSDDDSENDGRPSKH